MFLGAIGQEAKVANAHESIGQDVQEEATDELFSSEGDGLQSVALFAIAVGEGDLTGLGREKTVIRDRDPVGIASQVIEDFFRRSEGLFSIDVPVLFVERLN